MKLFNLNQGIIFRYYGLDIIIDKNYKPWLLEVNKYPFMDFYDEVNKINKLDFTQSLLNLLGFVSHHFNDLNVILKIKLMKWLIMLFVNLIEILEILKEFFLLKIIWNIIRNLLNNMDKKILLYGMLFKIYKFYLDFYILYMRN